MELEGRLERLVKTTCDFLVEMGNAPPIINQNDEQVVEHWKQHVEMRSCATIWGRSSRELSEDCIRLVLKNSDPDDTEDLRETWDGPFDGSRKGANVTGVCAHHRPELARLLINLNEKISKEEADRILRRLDRNDGFDDWKFRGTVEHVDDPNPRNSKRSADELIKYGFGRITRDEILDLSEQLIELYDAVRGDALGKTILVPLMEKYHEEERNPERHNAWFVVKRLRHLIWTRYVSNENMTGPKGLISAVMHDNLATVVGTGGRGKTALVYEFIRRNYEDRTRTDDAYVEPFEKVMLFSTKGPEQGDLNTYDGSGGTLDPNDGGLSIMRYMPPGSYSEFIEQICSLVRGEGRNFGESKEDWALGILMKQNVLVVLDNYEDIEREKRYSEDKESYENFLDKWGKKLVDRPKGRIIMTSRTGLQRYSRSGFVKVKSLGPAESKELLKQRYLWLFARQGGSPSSRMLEEVLDANSRTFEQILEKEEDFRELLWGHPLVIQLFAVVLKEEDSKGGTGAEILNRVMNRFRSGITHEVLQYITKKTERLLFSDDKGSHMFEILLHKEEMIIVPDLRKETEESLSITHADVVDFKNKLDGVGYLEYGLTDDGAELFRMRPEDRNRVMLARGVVISEQDAGEEFELIEEPENWQKYFQAEVIREDEVSAPNYRDHKTLERICRRLLGEGTNARLGLDSDILRVSQSGLSHRKILLFENMMLGDEIVGKYTGEELEKHGEKVVQAIKKLDLEVSRTMLRFVRDIGKGSVAWQSVTEPTSRQIRRVISRLALNPDPFEDVKEYIAPFIDGIHEIVDSWRPVEGISRNHQLDEILRCWGEHLSVEWDFSGGDEEYGLEIRSWWIEIAWILWDSDVGLNFPLLGGMLSNYLLDQQELDQKDGIPNFGGQERYSGMLREMQQHPLFCDHVDLSRFAEQGVGGVFHLDDEGEIMTLNQALTGDILYIPDRDWEPSRMGSYEEVKAGGQAIYRDPSNSETGGGEWLVTKRDSFGMKVELHEADLSSEVSPTESSPEVELEETVNWCEDILQRQDDYMSTSSLGAQISERLGTKVSTYLKERGEGKFTEFLQSSSLGSRLHFRDRGEYRRHDIKLLDDGQQKPKPQNPRPKPQNPSDVARCIEILGDQLAINSEWPPYPISKQVRNILVSEGVTKETVKLKNLAWSITVGSLKRAEKININGGSEIDVSPGKLLDAHYNYLVEKQLLISVENRIPEGDKLANWKESVEGHLTPTGERLVPLPKLQKTDKTDYESYTVAELKALCKERGIKGYSKLKKAELIGRLKESSSD